MGGFFSNLLGTDGVVEGIKDGIDKAVLTDEERLDYQLKMLKGYEPFKIIQRYLALATAGMFSFVLLIQSILFLLGLKFVDLQNKAAEFGKLESVEMVGWAFIAVMGLYFSGGVINSFKK